MSRGRVMLLPGIGGNTLAVEYFLGRRLEIWLGYATLIAGGWRLLDLDQPIFLSPGGALRLYYGPLIDRLQARGWDVWSPPIDWRLPLQTTAADLKARLNLLASPTHIIAHSRGGLVARALLHQLEDDDELHLVGRCCALGTPHQGSLAAATLLGGFQRTKQLLYQLLSISQSLLTGGWPRIRLNQIISRWPAVYQLLPRPGSTWLPPDDVNAVYTADAYSAHGLPIDAELMNAGKVTWIGLPEAPAVIPWLDVIGSGFPTPIGVANAEQLNSPAGYVYSELGDGTVPMAAATQEGRPTLTIRASHDSLPQDGRAIDAASDWFLGSLVV